MCIFQSGVYENIQSGTYLSVWTQEDLRARAKESGQEKDEELEAKREGPI